jgi:hypothetical protein
MENVSGSSAHRFHRNPRPIQNEPAGKLKFEKKEVAFIIQHYAALLEVELGRRMDAMFRIRNVLDEANFGLVATEQHRQQAIWSLS